MRASVVLATATVGEVPPVRVLVAVRGESASILRRNLIRFTPRGKSGKMQDAARVEIDEGSEEVTLGYDEQKAPHAKFVLSGTAPHIIRAKNASALRFTTGGKTVFAKQVNHPGTKEQGTRIYSSTLNASQGAIDGMLHTYGEELMVRIATNAPVGVGRIRIR